MGSASPAPGGVPSASGVAVDTRGAPVEEQLREVLKWDVHSNRCCVVVFWFLFFNFFFWCFIEEFNEWTVCLVELRSISCAGTSKLHCRYGFFFSHISRRKQKERRK